MSHSEIASPSLSSQQYPPCYTTPSMNTSGPQTGQNKKKKYIFQNGVMMINPEYQDENKSSPSSISSSHIPSQTKSGVGAKIAPTILPLAIISSPQDLDRANQEKYQEEDNPAEIANSLGQPNPTAGKGKVHEDTPIAFSLGTLQAIDHIQQSPYQLAMTRMKEQSLFEGLVEHFVIHEVPIGLISKLILLQEYHLHFMIDDSGSMRNKTDVTYRQATMYIKKDHNPDDYLSRIEEAEDRLHIIMDILSYIPVKSLTVSFMNLSTKLSFDLTNKSPKTFQIDAHAAIQSAFRAFAGGGTPTLSTLVKSFTDAGRRSDPTLHFLFTDGVPSDCSVDALCQFLSSRSRPDRNPITLISCTNNESECAWMKEVEERALYCSELDDYHDEKAEVLKDQGPAFPYTKGLWLVSHLIAAISPHDLDAIDESLPFTKHTLDELMGRVHTRNEYAYYWKHHPKHNRYAGYYNRFLTEDLPAKRIVPLSKCCTIM